MSQKKKLLKKFLERPATLRYSEIVHLLLGLGFSHSHGKGSHNKFRHPKIQRDIILPLHNNDCATYYKVEASNVIKSFLLIFP